MTLSAFAPAKVNLYLHVGPLASDGYHPIESWMVFADVGDRVTLEPGPYTLELTGPNAAGVPPGPDNLVLRARDAAMAEMTKAKVQRFGITLEKHLPTASGLGGGSSDAAAALKLLGEYLGLPASRLTDLARSLGSDVPACLTARSLIARGRGEQISPGFEIAPLHAVLVNPGRAVSTGAVFALYDQGEIEPLGDGPPVRPLASLEDVLGVLDSACNDLEVPARTLEPAIGEVLEALRSLPAVRLARMSGSGATCFGLCAGAEEAADVAERLSRDHPGWWARACTLS